MNYFRERVKDVLNKNIIWLDGGTGGSVVGLGMGFWIGGRKRNEDRVNRDLINFLLCVARHVVYVARN